MKGYKGKIVFVKDTEDGMYSVWHSHMAERATEGKLRNTLVLAVCDVDVTFADTRTQEIEAYKKAIEIERAESQHKINIMLGKIQNLQALEHD